MADLVSASAQAIADALAPTPQAPAARWRWGSVVSVNADGTMNVSIGGATVPSIRCAQHVMGAQVGDRVRVLYCGTECMVDAVRASSALMSLPSITTIGGFPVNTTGAGVHSQGVDGSWYWIKFSDGMAICEYEGASVSRNINSTSGSIYWGQDTTVPDFPFEFLFVPTINVALSGSGNCWAWNGNATNKSVGTVYFGRGTAYTNWSSAIKISAIGRWK